MAVSCILAFKSEQSPDLAQTGLHFIAPRIHCLIPSAMAPSTRMPDSLTTQSGWNSSSFSTGSRGGSNSSRNTFARTSRAAAEHLPTEDMHMLYMGLDVSLSTNVTLGFESFLWIRQYEYLNITDIHDIECNHLHRKHQVCEQSLISFARHLRRFQSERLSSSSSSSSSLSSPSSPSLPSCRRVTVRDLWKRGFMSCSLSGTASSSSTSPYTGSRRSVWWNNWQFWTAMTESKALGQTVWILENHGEYQG